VQVRLVIAATFNRTLVSLLGLISLLGLEGCGLGGLIYGDTSRTIERPFLVHQEHPSSDRVRRIGQSPSTDPLRADTLQREWGAPDTIEPQPGNPDVDRWTYRTDRLRWHGPLLILVVLPLPLLVPFGHDYIVFTIRNGIVTEATEVRSRPKYGGFCGLPLIQALMFQQLPLVCTAGAVHLTEP
jgi:hypothetical protein